MCLAWIHWHLDEYQQALGRLSKSIEEQFSQLDGTNNESAQWTKVCALKASYIKGSSQVKFGAASEALETYESTLPIFTVASSENNQGKELKIWTELYLTGFCMLSSYLITSEIKPIRETETLAAFRGWATFWDSYNLAPLGGHAPFSPVSRRQVWKQYYTILSEILQQELPFPTTSLITTNATQSTRLQQRAELQRVESRYEAILLSEMSFPKAEEVGEEVEAFVDLVMGNWRILCGGSWKDRDLGEGGVERISRGVLDTLYRAATKTFHSTPILRHLFTVHLAIADFDLAFKAFETYMDIVKRGKSRVEKTGDQEPGLDDDETVIKTASECIRALARYGSREGAEKAKDLGHFFETWLDLHHPLRQLKGNGRAIENGTSSTSVSPDILAISWRSIGIGYANWARFTFDGAARGEIQQQAISCFRKALHPNYKASADVATLFALGTILAERRELSVAIEVVKSGLLPSRSQPTSSSDLGSSPQRFLKERSLIPLWHLMALLLSAKQEFLTAARSCEGAFEQFQDPRNLFGDADLSAQYISEHLQVNEKPQPKILGVVDDMDDFEKENVLEVKMTQLTLIEVIEGPEIAVNASDELLSLYARLFGDPLQDNVQDLVPNSLAEPPPKSSAGTLRSIKGSIFGRSGRGKGLPQSQRAPDLGGRSAVSLRPQTTQTIPAPMIQVTNANGRPASQHHHLKKEHPAEKRKARSNSLSDKKSRERSSSTGQRQASMPIHHTVTKLDGEEYFTPIGDDQHADAWPGGAQSKQNASSGNHSAGSSQTSTPSGKAQQRSPKEKNSRPTPTNSIKHKNNPLQHAFFDSSSTNPATVFPKDQQRRRRITTLIKVWLLISGFYRRAALYEDAKGAIEEADKLVSSLDQDVSGDTTGNISITNPGWGGGKSVNELWGDVFAERGHLAVAQSSPYNALEYFESALTRFQDHPSAIVGVSNILLDIYSQDLLPPPSIPPLILPVASTSNTPSTSAHATPLSSTPSTKPNVLKSSSSSVVSHGPLGISTHIAKLTTSYSLPSSGAAEPNHKEPSTELQDRIAARDRASFLLNTLTKLGKGWNYSEAWFALARAYELQGQPDKAKEVLWWCVELEEGRAVRDWSEISRGGYVL